MKRRIYTVRPPRSGVVLRWGREEPGADPDLVGAWAPGSKAAAYRLMTIFSDHRKELEEVGIDITTLRITAETRKEAP